MLREAIKKIRGISLEDIALDAFKERKEEAIDLNTESQLFDEGIDAKGKKLGEYSPFTIQIKRAKGQKTDFITLKDEGDFYREFFVKASKFPVLFDSNDSKTQELKQRFGKEIFGLTQKSIDELNNEYIRESIQEKFKKSVSGAFDSLR